MQGVIVPKHLYIRYDISDAAFNNMTNIKNRVIIIYSVNLKNYMMMIIVAVIVNYHHHQFVTPTTVRRKHCIVSFVH